jgi:UDP-GlcNAc:undecaprenyl-phosphate GlcNAc-1-phosphate transferase
MRTAAVAFLASSATAAVLTPAVRNLAHRCGWLDHALTSRKIHGKPIPRLGGLAIVLAFFAPLVALLFVNSGVGSQFYAMPRRAFGLFAGGLAIAALGVLDDLRGTGAKTKFLVQFAVAGAMYWLGYRIDVLANPFGPDIQLGLLGLPFTLLWIAGVINAMNLIDGLDGLAGGVALIAVVTTFVLAAKGGGAPLMVLFTAALAGAVLGFLFYNFNPASIFLGDTGSLFLGYVFAVLSLQSLQKGATAVIVLAPLLALGFPILEVGLTFVRRALVSGMASVLRADHEHIHHRLIARGMTHRNAVLTLYVACIGLGGFAFLAVLANGQGKALLVAIVATAIIAGVRALGYRRR